VQYFKEDLMEPSPKFKGVSNTSSKK
jgi:hypothetical protein